MHDFIEVPCEEARRERYEDCKNLRECYGMPQDQAQYALEQQFLQENQ
jgi:hypothetical protein